MGIFTGGVAPGDLRKAATNANLGATLDNTGDVLLYDDFSAGLAPWTLNPIGTGAVADLTLTQSLDGLVSCRMIGGTGATIGCAIVRPLSFVQLSPVGMEIAFTVDANTGIVDAFLAISNGTTEYDFIIRVNAGTGQLQYRNSAGVFTNFSAQVPSTTAGLFHHLKFVGNPVTGLYDRVIFNTTPISSIVGIAAPSLANASAYLQATVRCGPAAGVSNTNYIGRVAVTVNEVL